MKSSLTLCVFAVLLVAGVYSRDSRARICEPGSVFMDDCNTCRCSSDGLDKSCTRIHCVGQFQREKRDSETCTPGSMFKIDCNDCVCPESGVRAQAACTLKACLDDVVEGERSKRQAAADNAETCTPGSMFSVGCNECLCPESGVRAHAACTLKGCVDDIVLGKRSRRQTVDSDICTPGSMFKIDCNDCVCPESGVRAQAACTLKAC